jgi:uncharacterized protein (DUF885 family)
MAISGQFTSSILLVSILVASGPIIADVSSSSPSVSKMHSIFDDQWARELEEDPVWASYLGDRRYNRQWQDLSAKARASRHEGDVRALGDLQGIDYELLVAEERINYELFERQYRDRIEAYQFDSDLMPISQRGGIQTLDETGNQLRMTTVADYDDWIARLNQVDSYVDQTIDLMKEGMAKGVVPPKITMQRVPAQIKKQLVENPEQSLFYKPFANIPDHFTPVESKRITSTAQEVIKSKVIPAYQKLYDFFTVTYLPACRESIGASALPNGRAYYEFRVRQFTTTEMTPDEVHQLGLSEVARIRKEMMDVINEVGFEGTFEEFIHFLRTDPKFYYDNPQELFEGYLAIAKRIDPQLVNLFGKLPRMPYGLKEIPEAIAPDTTTAYYTTPAADGSRAGYYYVNLYKPETRPKYEMEVLTVHESVPGHHLQLALQQELEQVPDFRRYSGFTVFVEGWGLYSERLGYELGLYKDPYSRFGQLTYDMWRAVRLVVDTGMHYKGWSRQKAIDYFLANAARQELDIVNEIDRYISWPGQALAYKLGQLKFLELRQRATIALGDKFDIKAFHDTVLGKGSVPLSILEKMVDQWIEISLVEEEEPGEQ